MEPKTYYQKIQQLEEKMIHVYGDNIVDIIIYRIRRFDIVNVFNEVVNLLKYKDVDVTIDNKRMLIFLRY